MSLGSGTIPFYLTTKPILYTIAQKMKKSTIKIAMNPSSLSTDFNFLSEEEIEGVCSSEREILRREQFDAVITGYRLTIITSCRLEDTPLIWIISGATHISEIVENADGILPRGKINRENSQLSKKFVEKLITSYSTNVKTWNNYLKKQGGVPFKNALELFSGDLNLVADYSKFYDFATDSSYKTIGPILIDEVGFTNPMKKSNKKILLSFGTSFKVSWVEGFFENFTNKLSVYIDNLWGRNQIARSSY